jgi:hypothetical protein
MDQLNKIDYMIESLYLAKDEIKYAQEYNLRKGNDEMMGRDFYSGYGYNHRTPNGTIIRESLKMVSRIAMQVANECILTNYCDEVFREDGEI